MIKNYFSLAETKKCMRSGGKRFFSSNGLGISILKDKHFVPSGILAGRLPFAKSMFSANAAKRRMIVPSLEKKRKQNNTDVSTPSRVAQIVAAWLRENGGRIRK